MLTYLRRLVDERTSLTEQMTRTSELAANEERDMTDVEQTALTGFQQRCAEIDRQLVQYNEQAESMRAFASLQSRLEQSRPEGTDSRSMVPNRVERRTAGQLFVESNEFRSYRGRGRSDAIELTDFVPFQQRAPITTADLAIPNYVLPPRVPDINIPPLLNIVDVVTVSSGVVEWVEVSGDPQAVVTPEGQAKTEAVLNFNPQSAALDTLAHWVQITRQALDDAAYIRSVIEGKLRRGITLAIADALNDAWVAATLPVATVPAGGTVLEAIRVGIATVQGAGYQPNAVVLNPADAAGIDLAIMAGTLNGAVVNGAIWGLTIVPSRFQTAGVALVGDFKAGVTWFDRNVSSVFISDSHQDLFIKNMLVILAETRGKAAIPEPNALVECSVAP